MAPSPDDAPRAFAPVPTNVVTGFLGAGKTTFIRSLLERRPTGERWAVLLNEFGRVRLDDSPPGSSDVSIREVEGGCICCTASVTLRVALTRLLREVRPARLLIEPTALGHPARVLDVLRDPWLGRSIHSGRVICVVDPDQFHDQRVRRIESYDEMIGLADVVVLADKGTGEGSEARADAVRSFVVRMRSPARTVVTAAAFPMALLDAPAAAGPT